MMKKRLISFLQQPHIPSTFKNSNLALTKNPKKIENYNIFIKEGDMLFEINI